MRKYSSKTIRSWEEFQKFISRRFKNSKSKKWIFRGHKSGESLKSSLERAVIYYPKDLKKKGEAEKRILREFKRRYHQYSSDIPKDEDDLEWFSLMQHYGAPTRLLDFTYSPYIAVYFALEHTSANKTGTETFEVFAVNAKWAIKQSIKNHGDSPEAKDFFEDPVSNTCLDRKLYKKYFIEGTPKKFVCPFNPFRLHERISLQNGVFMCPGAVNKKFEENLESLGGDKRANIIKITLKFNKTQIREAREKLYDLNITRATLFPGLEGFARSLAIFPPKMLISKKV